MPDLVKAKDLPHGVWFLHETAWWQIDKVEETNIVENVVILHMHIPKEHFPQRAAPVREFNIWATMMVPENYEFETRKDI